MDDNRSTRTDTAAADTTDGDQDTETRRPLFRGCGCWIAVIVVLLLGGGGATFVGATTVLRQEQPLPLEPEMADLALRWVAVPAEFTDRRMPRNDAISTENGAELYEVQCALCHGNNGNGDGPFGVTMYPKASNLHQDRTRTKTDGQLFWIIAHGVNLTGMPAWGIQYGGSMGDNEIWSLVKFIREEYHGETRP